MGCGKSWSPSGKLRQCPSSVPEGQWPGARDVSSGRGEGDVAGGMSLKGTGAFTKGRRNHDPGVATNNNSHSNYFYDSAHATGNKKNAGSFPLDPSFASQPRVHSFSTGVPECASYSARLMNLTSLVPAFMEPASPGETPTLNN